MTNVHVNLRGASERDLDALVPLLDDYRAYYGQSPAPDRGRAFLRDRIEASESVIFLAEVAGAPAGFCQLYPMFTTVRLGRLWVLNDLFVAPEHRRRGVGRALLERAIGHARETGANRVTLKTEHDNTGAQALYRALGFVRDERFWTFDLSLVPEPGRSQPSSFWPR